MATEQPTGWNSDPGPAPSGGYPPPVPERRNARGAVFLAGFVGLVAGVVLVGGAWLLFGNDGASSDAISAPERLDKYVRQGDAEAYDRNDRGRDLAERRADWDRRSGERLSAAYHGAGAVVQTYTDDDLETTLMLEAVRAPATVPPYVPYTDPKVLGMDRPIEEVREFGAVSCAIRNNAPDQSYVISCGRSAGDLTVQITHVSGDLGQDPAAVAKLVDIAWDELA